jgi:cell division protein FtsL
MKAPRLRGAPPALDPAAAPWVAALLAALLVACALALVVSQYRTRVLFAEIEAALGETKRLESEGARLRSDLGHAAQPATVEAVAHRLGMHPIDPDRVVVLAQPVPALAAAGAAAARAEAR